MQNSYTNKVVLITGGTSGIGKVTAIAFAEAGAKVVITGRREKEGAELVAEIEKTGGTAAFVRTDVAKEADVVKAINFVLSTHGRLDTSEEIAAAVLYLASDAAKFTTGTILAVDGGWSAT